MDKTLLIKALVQGQDALLTLNGMVLCKLLAGQEVRVPAHEFIQSGENRIQVHALGYTGLRTDSPLAAIDCSAQVWVELQKDRGAESIVQSNVLFKLEESFVRGQRIRNGRMLNACVDLPVTFPRWRYLDVLQSCADESDHDRIQDFVLHLMGLLQAGKVSTLLPYFSVRNQEIATAYGLDLQQVHSTFTAAVKQLVSGFTLSELSLDPNAWLFYKVGDASVYALLNSACQPLLQFQSSQGQAWRQWPLHVGVLGGEVFVLR